MIKPSLHCPSYNMIKPSLHCPSTEVECVAPLCPGDQLPPPCGDHPRILAVGVVPCLLFLLLVVVDVDMVLLPGAHCRLEAEWDSPHTGQGHCKLSWKHLLHDVMTWFKQAIIPDCVSRPMPGFSIFVEECRSLSYVIFEFAFFQWFWYPHQTPFWSSISILCCQESTLVLSVKRIIFSFERELLIYLPWLFWSIASHQKSSWRTHQAWSHSPQ